MGHGSVNCIKNSVYTCTSCMCLCLCESTMAFPWEVMDAGQGNSSESNLTQNATVSIGLLSLLLLVQLNARWKINLLSYFESIKYEVLFTYPDSDFIILVVLSFHFLSCSQLLVLPPLYLDYSIIAFLAFFLLSFILALRQIITHLPQLESILAQLLLFFKYLLSINRLNLMWLMMFGQW